MRRWESGNLVLGRGVEKGGRSLGRGTSKSECFFCASAAPGAVFLRWIRAGLFGRRKRRAGDRAPCEACAAVMAAGVLLIEVDDARSYSRKNPFRTGRCAVVTEKGIRDCVGPPELVDRVIQERFAFVGLGAWEKLGFNRYVGR